MPKTTAYRAAYAALFCRNVDAAGIGDATGLRGSSVAGSFYISLHSAEPGLGALVTQATNEIVYPGYGRVAIARSVGAWNDVAGDGTQLGNAVAILFGTNTGPATPTATHYGIGVASSGSTTLLYYKELTTPLSITVGLAPNFPINSLIFAPL